MKAILIAAIIFAVAQSSSITIDTSTRNFQDPYGRNLLFHGVATIYKLPPYYPPILDSFDPVLSLAPIDFENLRSWGFNFIRLYMSWEGTEIQPGVYNTTYIEQVREIVRTAA
jgi:endoglycosylceramidase